MISKKGLIEYKKRKFSNSDRVKAYSEKALDGALSRLDPVPFFYTAPYKHQKAVFLLCVKYPGYFNQLDMGGGKTKIILDLFRYYHVQKGSVKRLLVLVPCVTNVDSWLDEIEIHAPDLARKGILPNVVGGAREEVLLNESNTIVIMTYAGWLRIVRQRNKKGKMVFASKAAKFEKLFDFVTYDESTNIGGSCSKFFVAARRLSKVTKRHYALTGTAFGKDPEIVYTQQFIADLGETFQTMSLFRGTFYTEQCNFWSGFNEWKVDWRKKGLLGRMLKHRSIRYNESEFIGLPLKVETLICPALPKATNAYYVKALEQFQAHDTTMKLLDNSYTRMRQLCSGYMKVDDNQGGGHVIEFDKNPKFDALLARVQEVPEDRKLVIFHYYVETGRYLVERLAKEGIKAERLYSGQKDKSGVQKRFKTSKKHRVLVANQAAAFGLNLQIANYGFFYELHDDPIIHRQMYKRVHRGQATEKRRRVYMYVFAHKGTIEEKIYRALIEKKRFFDIVVEGRKKPHRVRLVHGHH